MSIDYQTRGDWYDREWGEFITVAAHAAGLDGEWKLWLLCENSGACDMFTFRTGELFVFDWIEQYTRPKTSHRFLKEVLPEPDASVVVVSNEFSVSFMKHLTGIMRKPPVFLRMDRKGSPLVRIRTEDGSDYEDDRCPKCGEPVYLSGDHRDECRKRSRVARDLMDLEDHYRNG